MLFSLFLFCSIFRNGESQGVVCLCRLLPGHAVDAAANTKAWDALTKHSRALAATTSPIRGLTEPRALEQKERQLKALRNRKTK